ncbi:hypothetical protein BN2497_2975 [Janthinobacterium sp. CG23_2]|nr:hypothetical protein BN2497_2975 [Janthinobacterium sp. CG23_2]CUU27885.1 hypothetical protein BN3177_2975 [Janthinobacterium sp. CG23_2]
MMFDLRLSGGVQCNRSIAHDDIVLVFLIQQFVRMPRKIAPDRAQAQSGAIMSREK